MFQQWGKFNDYNDTDTNTSYNNGDQDIKRYTNEHRYIITNQRGNSSNCIPKCFAEKGSRVSYCTKLVNNGLNTIVYLVCVH